MELGAGASRGVPPGFRFHPTGEEIIIHYLLKKVKDTRFASILIGEVDINTCEPWELPSKLSSLLSCKFPRFTTCAVLVIP